MQSEVQKHCVIRFIQAVINMIERERYKSVFEKECDDDSCLSKAWGNSI